MEFKKKLGVAYYTGVSLIIGLKYSDYFGEDGTLVKVKLGDDKHLVDGYINRTANNNGIPGIMIGKKYTEWVQKVFSQWEYMNVKIINP